MSTISKQNNLQAEHWVDKLSAGILKWQQKNQIKKLYTDDMKTPSGRVHTGSLRGVVLHDVVAKVLRKKTDQEVINTFVFNDMDPMDGLPAYLAKEEYEQHMGKPLFKIPTPPPNQSGLDIKNLSQKETKKFIEAKNFAELYAFDFVSAFESLGCEAKVIWSHELYESGQMDEVIKMALDNVNVLRNIYHDVANYDLPEKWYPFQVICPECGKVGTTLTIGWDGEQVSFECQKNKVKWAVGCGHKGKISPFGGNGKLLWKVDWPAHWKTLGVTIEGQGKDHSAAGGSRDMAGEICKKVFDIAVPFDIPYEWLVIRGTKMSSSKGIGTSARNFVKLFPPEIGRFLFVNKHYNQVIDFDPTTMAVPDLFDEYDLGAQIFWKQEKGDQRLGRSFELAQVAGRVSEKHFLSRFRDLAIWFQHPELDLVEKFSEIKGSPLTELEIKVLNDRKKYAQVWVENYASSEFQLTPRKNLPEQALTLSEEQLVYLEKAVELVGSRKWSEPQDFQQALFNLSKVSIGVKKGFQVIYLALIGKTHGPRAAWFLLSIDSKLLQNRVEQIRKAQQEK